MNVVFIFFFLLTGAIHAPIIPNDIILNRIAKAETGHLPERKRVVAISRTGAIGYMQILPSTAREACPNLNLWNKKDNIRCALNYVLWLQRHYCGRDMFCTIMSYRHGHYGYLRRLKSGRLDIRYWRRGTYCQK